MTEIIVKSQQEFDAIPQDFDGRVYIKSPRGVRIIVTNRKGSVEARENSSVEAWGNSSVVAWENSSVEARENSSVVARENSSVEAWENSSVEAWGNSSVEAWENSSVVGQGNSQITKYSDSTSLKVSGNARIVTLPSTPEEYCDFYGIEIRDGQAILYKAVRPDLRSFHDYDFQYAINETKKTNCDSSPLNACSFGLHVSHLLWALDFGRGRDFKILECSVPLDKIIVPLNASGRVRTSELRVLREVPLEECGTYGKTLARQQGRV